MNSMHRLLPFFLLTACNGCRVAPPDTGSAGEMDLGHVPLGARLSLRIEHEGLDASATLQGDGLEQGFTSDSHMDLVWGPGVAGPATGELELSTGEVLILTLEVDPPVDHWPDPIALETGLDILDTVAETGLGTAIMPETGPIPSAIDPVSGNAFFGDSALGRAWRMDGFYNHPSWSLWVAMDRDTKEGWQTPPSCFEDQSGLLQDGSCDGTETDPNGMPPRGWRYFHGGFAGDGELEGLKSLVSDAENGRIWATGPGWIQAIDTDLYTSADEGENSYSFTQLIEDFIIELDESWGSPLAVSAASRLWLLEPEGGLLGPVDLPVEDGPWASLNLEMATTHLASDGDRLFVLGTESLHILTPASKSSMTPEHLLDSQIEIALPLDLLSGEPTDLVAHEGEAWIAWGDAVVHISELETRIHPLADGGELRSLALDAVSGGNADDLEILYLAGQTDGIGWLQASTPEGGWLGEPITLPAAPLSMVHAPDPHDLYLIYGEGDSGCEDALSELCTDGSHPPVVQAFYNPYSLVPPTSTGHPLNLFLSPIIETPKDSFVNSDYTSGRVCTPGKKEEPVEDLDLGCCALTWSMSQRLEPNIEYFELLATLGDETETLDDDPTLAWGINPSVLRQAWNCGESSIQAYQDAGQAIYTRISELIGERSSLTTWTHTALNQGDGTQNHDWWMSLAFEEGVDYELPLDSQEEYLMLHESLSLIATPGMLGDWLEDVDLSSSIGAGNSLDAVDLVDEESGWSDADPSWVRPIRDGSLASGAPARSGYYFLSSGTDATIGTNTYRKKELWPIDIRQRAQVMDLPEGVLDFGGEGSSGLYNLPGMSWEIGTLVNLSEGGAYRESLMYGQNVTEENWEFVFRSLRRTLATADPDATKSWYQHIFDVTNPSGLYASNSHVIEAGNPDSDVTAAAILRINSELVEPGYARWSLPEDIVEEASSD